MPLAPLGTVLSDAAASAQQPVPYFVPQGWVALVSMLMALLVEVVRVQVAELSKRRVSHGVAPPRAAACAHLLLLWLCCGWTRTFPAFGRSPERS